MVEYIEYSRLKSGKAVDVIKKGTAKLIRARNGNFLITHDTDGVIQIWKAQPHNSVGQCKHCDGGDLIMVGLLFKKIVCDNCGAKYKRVRGE